VKLLIAIPAFNEELTIAEAIEDIQKNLPTAQILVINDGSTDNTKQVAETFDVFYLEFPFNMGVGAAMRAAFKFAEEENYSHVLQFDADGQHSAYEASKLIALSDDAEIIIGSRFLKSNEYKVSKIRRMSMIVLSFVVSKRIGHKLTDVTSGFRLTGREAIKFSSLNYPPEYLGDTVESILMAGHEGFKIQEVFVLMSQRKGGEPSQNFYKLVTYLARVVAVIVISSLQYRKPRNKK
jgi:glycosyltransferase involved in cell wall biosynthesis